MSTAPSVPGSATSASAAKAVTPHLGALEAQVLGYLTVIGDSTDEEGMDGTCMLPNTYRPRRIRLVELGLVKDTGFTRVGRSGRQMTVWAAV